MARTVATGAAIRATAERLAADRALVSAIETAILIAPNDTPAAIAGRLLETPRAAALLAQAHAEATGATAATQALAEAATGGPGATVNVRNDRTPAPQRGGAGGGGKPPTPPPGGFSPPPPPRSRFSQLVERLVREQAPLRARRIAATSGRIIAGALGDVAAVGHDPEKAARLLEERLAGQVSRQRARVIARTELGAAQNAATLAIARDRAAAGEVIVKVWAAIDDARTRPSHAEADNQVRELNEPFLVGESRMQHPGDPTAPVGELANCRCALIIRQPVAADRRAIRR